VSEDQSLPICSVPPLADTVIRLVTSVNVELRTFATVKYLWHENLGSDEESVSLPSV
jgi:hypothetical protein